MDRKEENNRATYIKWAEKQTGLPLFIQPWWMNAVAGEWNWSVALASDKAGNITGALPYGLARRKGFKWIETPSLSLHSGPWLNYPQGMKPGKRYSFENEILSSLALQLPRAHFIRLKFSPKLTNCLPFFWQGFQCTIRYTYQLNLEAEERELFSGFSRNARRNIKKAEQRVAVVSDMPSEVFYEVNKLSFVRRKVAIPYSFNEFQRRDMALEQKKCRKLFFAVGPQGEVHAAAYLIWDQNAAYYHLSGYDPRFEKSGAGFLLIWEAIKFAKRNLDVDVFDFQGSMIKGVEEVRRQFGAHQQCYFQAFRARNRWLKGLYAFIQG